MSDPKPQIEDWMRERVPTPLDKLNMAKRKVEEAKGLIVNAKNWFSMNRGFGMDKRLQAEVDSVEAMLKSANEVLAETQKAYDDSLAQGESKGGRRRKTRARKPRSKKTRTRRRR